MSDTIFGILLGLLLSALVYLIYNLITMRKCISLNDAIQRLVRQAARWSTAATQDRNSMIAVLHANYGQGYLMALREIATDEQIANATGIDLLEFQKAITDAQDFATMRMVKLCPEYAPKETYLTRLGGER